MELGVGWGSATFLLSYIGIANTLGRIVIGWISDRPWIDCLVIHNFALIVGGIATAFAPYLPTYLLLVVYCFVFGFCIGKKGSMSIAYIKLEFVHLCIH